MVILLNLHGYLDATPLNVSPVSGFCKKWLGGLCRQSTFCWHTVVVNKGCHKKREVQDPAKPNGVVSRSPKIRTVGETDVEGVEYEGEVGAHAQHCPQENTARDEAIASGSQEAAKSQEETVHGYGFDE